MNILNKCFDKIFLITTLNSNRINYTKKHLSDNQIEFDIFVATNYELISKDVNWIHKIWCGYETESDYRPTVSLVSSYVSIFQKSLYEGYKNIAILEDDIFFVDDWQNNFYKFISNVDVDWDILNMGYFYLNDKDAIIKKYNDYASIPLNWYHTLHFTAVSNKMYSEFLDKLKEIKYELPMDYVYMEMYKNEKYKCFVPNSIIAKQKSFRSYTSLENNMHCFKSLLV